MASRNLVWTGDGGTDDFNDAANWMDTATGMAALTPPTSIDFVTFEANAGGTIGGTAVGNAETMEVGGLGNWTFDGAITLSGQSTGFTPTALLLYGTASFSGARLNATAGLVQINAPTHSFVVTVENASTVTAAATFIANDISSYGSLLVTGANTVWHDVYNASVSPTSGQMLLGYGATNVAGEGSLTVTAHATVTEDVQAIVGVIAGNTGDATVSDYGIWNVGTGSFYIGESGFGTVTVESHGTIVDAGVAYVASNAGSTGYLDIEAGGTVSMTAAAQTNSAYFIIANHGSTVSNGVTTAAAQGDVLVNGAGALLDLGANPLQIGGSTGGSGTLTIENGGSVSAATADSNLEPAILIANAVGDVATVTVDGSGSQLSASGYVFLGRGGTANLSVENHGTVLVTDATNGSGIGIGAGRGAGPNSTTHYGGSGTATVTSGGTLDLDSTVSSIIVGGNGVSGELDVNTGGIVLAGTELAVGTATMAGGSLYGGAGIVNIGAGGTVRVTGTPTTSHPAVVIGTAASTVANPTTQASGTVTVSGTGALLDTNGGGLYVGILSSGSLTVSHAGSVVAATPNSATLAALSVGKLGIGTVTVTDAGSALTANGFSYLGSGGTGNLLVENSATMTVGGDPFHSGGLSIGGTNPGDSGVTAVAIGGTGTAVVTTGGTILSGGGLYVGSTGAKGLLTIGDGTTPGNTGTVEVGYQIRIGNNATLAAAGGLEITATGTTTITYAKVYNGAGSIDVDAGGLLQFNGAPPARQAGIVVGADAGSTGTLTVNGAQATVNAGANRIDVGEAGSGALLVENQGLVEANALDIGAIAGGSGSVDVTGADSLLRIGGDLDIGTAGSGTLTVGTGGTVALAAGSTLTVGAGGTVVGAGGVIDPPSVYDNTGLTTGPLTVDALVAIDNTSTFIAENGLLELNGPVIDAGVLQIQNGGTLQLDQSVAATQTVEFIAPQSGTPDGVLDIKAPDGFAPTIAGYAAGDTVQVYGIAGQDAPTYSHANGNTTLTYGNGLMLTFAGTYADGSINVDADPAPPPPPPAPCFLAGTRIATDGGEVAVQDLRIGDRVITSDKRGAAAIRWIGHRRLDARSHPSPTLVHPVRIRRGAFADSVPHRDLLISPDHAVFIDGLLVPARLLVNGATILQDLAITDITYFHIELERHAVLLSEGLPTESYLDTGNRGLFANGDAPLTLHPDLTDADGQAARESLSCAPFAADPARVAPLWRRLAARASHLGHEVPAPATTSDPALRIRAGGRDHDPIAVTAERHIFAVPRSATTVRLVSRAAVPCDVAPWIDDRRRLGVRVGRIVMSGAGGVVELPIDHPELTAGWHPIEPEWWRFSRWTDGDAGLPVPPGTKLLEVHLAGPMTYHVEPDSERNRLVACEATA